MCLISIVNTPRIAPCDIPIYKYVYVKNGRYITPFRLANKFFKPKKRWNGKCEQLRRNSDHKQMFMIGSGFVHAYIAPSYLLFEATKLIGYIPKGTEYFYDKSDRGICAKKMKFYFYKDLSLWQKIKYHIGLPYLK